MASSSSFNDFVTCPYNKAHRVLCGRLTKHLDRCSRNFAQSNKLLVCPFNENHRFDFRAMQAHIKECPDRASLEKHLEREELPPASAQERLDTIECEDDWDQEPDVPTYNPNAYCEENLVLRGNGLQGQSRAVRRDFREKERRRFADKR